MIRNNPENFTGGMKIFGVDEKNNFKFTKLKLKKFLKISKNFQKKKIKKNLVISPVLYNQKSASFSKLSNFMYLSS